MSKKQSGRRFPNVTRESFHPLKGHPFVVPVLTFLVLFFVTLVAYVGMSGITVGATDTRLVNLHIDGDQEVVPTRADTVSDMLERLEIVVAEGDVVQPDLDTPISQDNFNIYIYHARPVQIIDGETKRVVLTAATTPQAIAEEVGIKVYPEDIIQTLAPGTAEPTDLLNDDIVAEKIVIERATPVKINLYGVLYDIRTHAKTVEELMREREIHYTESSVFPALETALTPSSVVFVTDPGKQITMVEESIPQGQNFVDDGGVLTGRTEVRDPGRPGIKVVVYEVAENGQRTVLQEVVVLEPVNRVIARGTRVVVSNPSENVKIGEQLAASNGWAGEQWYCLYQLWQKESRWSHTAHNGSSGAHGIPQALPGSKMASAGADWQTNPATQIRWGMGYISGRYGTPCSAWQHSRTVGWY